MEQALLGDAKKQDKRKQVETEGSSAWYEEELLYCMLEHTAWSVGSSSVEIFQNHLDVFLCQVL